MFLILEGEGEVRFGSQTYPIRRHDVIACPPGGAEVAHQIINTGNSTMRYLALSNIEEVEICEYPDSNKIGVFADTPGATKLRGLHRCASAVDYYDGENTQPTAE
jgi:uncharacterized cupin superfamily protein